MKDNNNLLNRMERKQEIMKRLVESLSSKEDKAITDIQKELGINRSTLNWWLKIFKKEGWIKTERLKDMQGRPTILRLNKKRIKEAQRLSAKNWKSFEEFNLKDILSQKILDEIHNNPKDKRNQKLVEMFKQFGKENYGQRIIFLLYDGYIDVVPVLTDKGKKYLKNHKKK